jgi:hypothetical protein
MIRTRATYGDQMPLVRMAEKYGKETEGAEVNVQGNDWISYPGRTLPTAQTNRVPNSEEGGVKKKGERGFPLKGSKKSLRPVKYLCCPKSPVGTVAVTDSLL